MLKLRPLVQPLPILPQSSSDKHEPITPCAKIPHNTVTRGTMLLSFLNNTNILCFPEAEGLLIHKST